MIRFKRESNPILRFSIEKLKRFKSRGITYMRNSFGSQVAYCESGHNGDVSPVIWRYFLDTYILESKVGA